MRTPIDQIVDLSAYPLDDPTSAAYRDLVSAKQGDLAQGGMFNLDNLMQPEALARAVSMIAAPMAGESFHHKRSHNIYFRDSVEGLPEDHPALRKVETANHTLCADQMATNPIMDLYAWPGLARFLADVMGRADLHTMDDPLACVNVMEYRDGEALNWHFDRSEFTTTLLLQAPDAGGAFQYRTDLRSENDPNHAGVEKLLLGSDPDVQTLCLTPGTLNVFKGVNTPHRVTPVQGATTRLIAVFSYYDSPGVSFSAKEQAGFYGRVA